MAEEEAEVAVEAAEGQPPAKEKGGTSVLILVVMSVLVMALTPIITIIVIKQMLPKTPEVKDKKQALEITLPQVQVNVAGTNGTRYAQVEIVLTVSDKDMEKFFVEQSETAPEGKLKRITATVNEIISSKNLNELLEKEAKQKLKKDIQVALNKILADDTEGMVKDVYFPGFLIQ